MKYRNDYRKLVVLCGFNETEHRSIRMYENPGKSYGNDNEEPYRKSPVYLNLNTLEEAMKHRGLVLFLKVDKDIDYIEFDKKYRRKLDYWFINLYHEDFKPKHNKWSNIYIIDEKEMFADYYDGFISEINLYFKKHPKLKLQAKKKVMLDNIHKYIRQVKEISTKELALKFEISPRNVERYMQDINILYNDIGYDYSKNIWYACK